MIIVSGDILRRHYKLSIEDGERRSNLITGSSFRVIVGLICQRIKKKVKAVNTLSLEHAGAVSLNK